MSKPFRFRDEEFVCEEMTVSDIIRQTEGKYKCSTPLFVYSKAKLHENVKSYLDALKKSGCGYQLNFSIKANPNLTILKELKTLGTSATLVSGNELKLALEAGFEPKMLMFNGNGKCEWETKLAIEHGVLLNVDSEWDLRQTIEICRNGFKEPKKARVLLRLNLNIDPMVHKFVSTGLTDCKFGLSPEGAEACIQLLEESACPADLVGLHCHLGSTIYRTDVFRVSLDRLLAFREKLIQRGFNNVNILNVGGGLGIDYYEREAETRPWRNESEVNQKDLLALRHFLLVKSTKKSEFDPFEIWDDDSEAATLVDGLDIKDPEVCAIKKLVAAITAYKHEQLSFHEVRVTAHALLAKRTDLKPSVDDICPCLTNIVAGHITPKCLVQSVCDLLKDKNLILMLEPGRSLVANASVMLTRVLGCKQTKNKRYILIDGAMTEVLRPALYGSYHHVTAIEAKQWSKGKNGVLPGKSVYDIVGPVCECTDLLAKERLLPNPEHGLLVIHDVGAYCHSMSSNYNIRMRPAEVLVDGKTCKLIRRSDSLEEFLAPYKNLD